MSRMITITISNSGIPKGPNFMESSPTSGQVVILESDSDLAIQIGGRVPGIRLVYLYLQVRAVRHAGNVWRSRSI